MVANSVTQNVTEQHNLKIDLYYLTVKQHLENLHEAIRADFLLDVHEIQLI